MKYENEHGDVIDESAVDLNLGYVRDEKRFVAHHEAVAEVLEQGHWQDVTVDGEVIGQTWIIDVPHSDAKAAWDEYETIGIYVLYTDDELKSNADKLTEDQRNNRILEQTKTAVMMIIASKMSELSDSDAQEVDALFSDWTVGTSYHAGDIVRFSGGLWRALQDSTAQDIYPPDSFTAGWKRIGEPDADGVFPWSQPLGATDAYRTGDKVTYDGATWTTTVDYNVWQPGVYGWVKDSSESDDGSSSDNDEWPVFVQPTGDQDAYHNGSKITYNGKHYVSVIDNNVWTPDAYPQGWQEA